MEKQQHDFSSRTRSDRASSLKPRQINEPARRKANGVFSVFFFPSFELVGITKHLMTGPTGKSTSL